MPGRRLSGAVVLLFLYALLPASAHASSEPSPGYAAFKVEASHGYELTVIAIGPPESRFAPPGDQGDVALLGYGPSAAAIYRAPATVTNSTVEADLGALGEISVKRVRTGRTKTVRDSCKGKRRKKIEAVRYEGTIEFHGEEGFSDASATAAPFDYATYLGFQCLREGSGGAHSKELPGARLSLHRNPETNELMLSAVQNRPGARTEVSVQVDEVRGEFEITRATGVRANASALRFDPGLRTATLAPPAPFAGYATYRSGARPSKRWTGNLTVDLPGYSDYPLTGPGIQPWLEHPWVPSARGLR